MKNARGRILVVEDDRGIRDFVRSVLLEEGYGVETAIDGMDAINQLTPAPDLILLDLAMPFMDGYEFLGRLRMSNKDHIPVLVMTAQHVGPTIDGAQGILRKPFELATLLQRVSDLLG